MHVTNEQVCSKLSQLTRVIYVINAKNDEYQSIIDSLISSYEEEHAYIIKCYQQQITALKHRIAQLTTNTASVVNGKVNEIHKRSLTAFNELQAQYDVFIKDTNNKVEQLRCEYDSKVNQMQRELTLFKGEYNEQYEQALEMKQEMINQKDTTITRLMTDIDKLKLSYEKQIYDIQNDKKSNIAHIKSSSECLIKQKDMALQSKDTLIHTHKEEIKALKVTLENKDIDFKAKEQSYQHEIELLKRTYENDMKQRLISSEAIIKQVQSENDNIKQKNIALINECKCLHDKEAQYTKLIAQHNSDMNMKNGVIERLNNEMQSLRSEIKSLEDTNCMLVDKIKNENEVNRNERIAFITKSQIQIDELHTQLNAVHNELKTKNEVIKELQSRIESINKQNKNEMQVITNKNAEVVSKYSKDIKELSEQKEALVSKHREEIDRITFQHTIQVNEMQLKLDSQISELKLDNIHLNERIDVYDSKINSCVAMFDDVVSGINELSDSLLIKQSNNDNNNGNSGDDSNSNSSSNVAKLKSSILTKLIAIQSKNTSFKNELRNIITTKPNNDNSLNSTAITAISKNSVKKLLPCTNGGSSSSSSRYTSTTLKRNPIKTTTTTINSVNTSRRSPFLRKSISQKIIITANNKK